MKIQVIKCKTCGEVFAAAKEPCSASWYKSVAKYLGNGSSTVETIESDGRNIFPDSPEVNKCCGKKVKHNF
jgi:hypothetical protein